MEETLGESKLKRVNSPSELIVGKKYFYFESNEEQLYQFRVNDVENMDFIPKMALCRRTLIYEGKGTANRFYSFKVIEDTPDHCNREGISFVGDTVPINESVFNTNNNESRLYHSKIIPEVAFGAGKKYRTKRLKSKRRRTRKNKRKTSLRKK